MKFLISTNT